MTHYSKDIAKQEILEFCKYPIPRTGSDIARILKSKVPGFYRNTPARRILREIRPVLLQSLIEDGKILEYNIQDKEFEYARTLLSLYFKNQKRKSPRKVERLYQINFLLLGNTHFLGKLPVVKPVNLEMCAMAYNFTKDKKIDNFNWKIINLLWCYSIQGFREKINIEMENINFDDKEKGLLVRILNHYNMFSQLFEQLPFNPSQQQASKFLLEL